MRRVSESIARACVLLACASVALAFVAGCEREERGAAQDLAAGARPSASAPPMAEVQLAAPEPAGRAPAAAVRERGGELTLAGRVVDERNEGVADIELELIEIRPGIASLRPPGPKCRSRADGSFLFEGLAAHHWRIHAHGIEGWNEWSVDTPRDAADELVLRVWLGGSIRGTVSWPDGTPVERFVVRYGHYEEAPGRDGAFELHGLSRSRGGDALEVHARVPGFRGEIVLEDVEVDCAPLALVLTRSPIFDLSVVAHDRTGQAFEAPWVFVTATSAEQEVTAQARGTEECVLRELGMGAWSVAVEAFGYLDTAREVVVGAYPPEPLVLELARGARLRGRVLDEGGRSVAGAEVLGNGLAETRSDGEGRFETVTSTTSVSLSAQKEGFASAEPVPLTVAAEALLEGLELRLVHDCQVAGRVLDAAGQPVAGVDVRALAVGRACLATTDAAGSFTMFWSYAGAAEVRALDAATGRRARARLTAKAGETAYAELRFAAEAPVSLRGRITRAGVPLQCALGFASANFVVEGWSKIDGSFEVRLPVGGAWSGFAGPDGWPERGVGEVRRFEFAAGASALELEFAEMRGAESLEELER